MEFEKRLDPKGRYFAYVRYSDKRQAAGSSVERQTERVTRFQDYLQSRTGIRPAVEMLAPHAGSARKGDNVTRGALADFIARIERGEIRSGDTLLLENLDRLSRQHHSAAQQYFYGILEAGVRILTLHNSRLYRRKLSLSDALIALVEMDLAYRDNAKRGGRIEKAWDKAISEGRFASAACPPWLERVKVTRNQYEYRPRGDRVKLLRKIFKFLADRDGRGMYQLANRLNSEGKEPPWNARAAGWHYSFIDRLRRNRAVLGEYTPLLARTHDDIVDDDDDLAEDERGRRNIRDKPVPNFFPAVIEPELFERAQRPGQTRGQPSLKEKNLVRGLATSALDGTPMIHRDTGGTKPLAYLVSRATQLHKTKVSHRVRYDKVERALLQVANFALSNAPSLNVDKHREDEAARVDALMEQSRKAVDNFTTAMRTAKNQKLIQILTAQANDEAERLERLLEVRKNLVQPSSAEPLDLDPQRVQSVAQRRAFREGLSRCAERVLIHADGEVQIRFRGWPVEFFYDGGDKNDDIPSVRIVPIASDLPGDEKKLSRKQGITELVEREEDGSFEEDNPEEQLQSLAEFNPVPAPYRTKTKVRKSRAKDQTRRDAKQVMKKR